MIFNNADNMMYGDKLVDRVYYGEHLVWERMSKWISDSSTCTICGFSNVRPPQENLNLNWCVEPYNVTSPFYLPIKTRNNYHEWIELHTLSPVNGYNIFGDKINIEIIEGQDNIVRGMELKKDEDYFKDVNLYLNYSNFGIYTNEISTCFKISDFAFTGRKLKYIHLNFDTGFEDFKGLAVNCGCYHIGKYAFYSVVTEQPSDLYLQDCSMSTSWNYDILIDEFAFANSTVVENVKVFGEMRLNYSDITIAKYSFSNCSTLKQITITYSSAYNITYENNCFQNCHQLNYELFPSAYENTYIQNYAFNNCGTNTDLYFSYNVQVDRYTTERYGTRFFYIYSNGFYKCNNLQRVYFGDKNKATPNLYIYENAFNLCSNISEIYFIDIGGLHLENNAFETQVANDCKFYISLTHSESYNDYDWVKEILMNCGVPENSIFAIE